MRFNGIILTEVKLQNDPFVGSYAMDKKNQKSGFSKVENLRFFRRDMRGTLA